MLQVTGYLDQECWEDNERGASAAGDYVLSVECADKPVDEWCADFDWCEDKELGERELDFATGADLDATARPTRQQNRAATRTARLHRAATSLYDCDEGVCDSYILGDTVKMTTLT